ncbi:MAG TPA: VOC family protein [Patescibacteria group bacterium]|nr:VOC family protein [Patescibacteria group bacterium]
MQKITPHLWFDKEAIEAADFYVSTLPKSKVKHATRLHGTPSGSVDIVTFELLGLEFQAISAGPLFKFNPSVSFHVTCKTIEEVDEIWKKLSHGGQVLMELGAYPFSERYGWLQDKYGLSWQIIYSSGVDVKQKITPVIMFVGGVCGKAEEAVIFWTSVFRKANVDLIMHYGKGEEPDKEGTLKYASFSLFGQEFGAMDSAHEHPFSFNEAISFIVNCDTQEEIDYYWEQLSAVPEAEQCGWLKDKFGISWQVVPAGMDEMLRGDGRERIDRVTQAFLVMKKLEIAKLKEAYQGK